MKLSLISLITLSLAFARGSILRHGKLRNSAIDWSSMKSYSKAQKFTQKINHFDQSSTDTFEQRYWVNDTYYKHGKDHPVFILVSGEAPARESDIGDGHWIHMAQKFGAICFMLEHRYYGDSRPTSDLSVHNLRYLSAAQALSDIVQFIEGMNERYKFESNKKWIAFGGSYAGTLVAWLRLKYPHMVEMSISTSGPLEAKANFVEYYEVVANVLQSYPGCHDAVSRAFIQVQNIQKSIPEKVDKEYRLCSKLSKASQLDLNNFYENLASNFAGIVQYNGDNRPTSKVKDITVKKVCDIMVDQNYGSEFNRMGYFNSLLLNATGEPCLDISYTKMIKEMRKSKWNDIGDDNGRQWFFQTCTEFGFYQTSDLEADLFTNYFPLSFFIQQCEDVFGKEFNATLLDSGIDTTNVMFGGKRIQATKVVYVQGKNDPWYPLGLTKTEDQSAPVILILGTAHCANMYEPLETDPDSLKEARLKIENYIKEIISI